MKYTIILLLLLIIPPAEAQNLILNGEAWLDSDTNGVADHWETNSCIAFIIDGRQYVSNGIIHQHMQSTSMCYILSFYMECTDSVTIRLSNNQVLAKVDPCSYNYIMVMWDMLDSLQFLSYESTGLFSMDSVWLTCVGGEVGISKLQPENTTPYYFDMLGRKLNHLPDYGYYIKREGMTSKVYCR